MFDTIYRIFVCVFNTQLRGVFNYVVKSSFPKMRDQICNVAMFGWLEVFEEREESRRSSMIKNCSSVDEVEG